MHIHCDKVLCFPICNLFPTAAVIPIAPQGSFKIHLILELSYSNGKGRRQHGWQAQTNATISRGVVTDDINLNDDKERRGHKRPISHKAYFVCSANSMLSAMLSRPPSGLARSVNAFPFHRDKAELSACPGPSLRARDDNKTIHRRRDWKKQLILLPSTPSVCRAQAFVSVLLNG